LDTLEKAAAAAADNKNNDEGGNGSCDIQAVSKQQQEEFQGANQQYRQLIASNEGLMEEIRTLQNKLDSITAAHQKDMEQCRRKRLLERAKQTTKLKGTEERLDSLVKTNYSLRRTVDKLQVKASQHNRQIEMVQREKARYQNKTRSLQANLKSLAWIATSVPVEGATAATTTATNSSSEDGVEKQECNRGNSAENSGDKNEKQLDASVNEITKILETLKNDALKLEKRIRNGDDVTAADDHQTETLHDNEMT